MIKKLGGVLVLGAIGYGGYKVLGSGSEEGQSQKKGFSRNVGGKGYGVPDNTPVNVNVEAPTIKKQSKSDGVNLPEDFSGSDSDSGDGDSGGSDTTDSGGDGGSTTTKKEDKASPDKDNIGGKTGEVTETGAGDYVGGHPVTKKSSGGDKIAVGGGGEYREGVGFTGPTSSTLGKQDDFDIPTKKKQKLDSETQDTVDNIFGFNGGVL